MKILQKPIDAAKVCSQLYSRYIKKDKLNLHDSSKNNLSSTGILQTNTLAADLPMNITRKCSTNVGCTKNGGSYQLY